jgi:hypothetical protein
VIFLASVLSLVGYTLLWASIEGGENVRDPFLGITSWGH